jgi:DNA invertase Pin-like site-specific DNA recombinase
MAVVGYARVSTEEQELTTQLEQLRAAGVEKVFQEKASGVREDRPELGRMLEYVREGDAVVVCKLDRVQSICWRSWRRWRSARLPSGCSTSTWIPRRPPAS